MSEEKLTHEQRAAKKVIRSRIDPVAKQKSVERKPDWIRIKLPSNDKIAAMKARMRKGNLSTVCEEAACPNLAECFNHGTATFLIMGDICTRRCSFCDVAHGRPKPLDLTEPKTVAETTRAMGLKYVVITSVDRDDLPDGGAAHFAAVIRSLRRAIPNIQVEILVPDFRNRLEVAMDALSTAPSDVFNHNIETVPSLYHHVRPAADYAWSLNVLQTHKARFPEIPTKSGIMVGLGETDEEVEQVLRDLRAHQVDMVTIGQYLQPTKHHLPVDRYVTPEQFIAFGNLSKALGFTHVASGPLVRSSYHADRLAAGESIS